MSARSRNAGAPLRWVPVDQLPEIARSLLSEDLGGRDVVPDRVADRVTALARQWADHGFTDETMRPWAELPPASAAYLKARGVDPTTLDQTINIAAVAKPLTLRQAIASGQLPAEQVYDLLVATGKHRDRGQPLGHADGPAQRNAPATPRPAPALFSHPTVERDDSEDNRRARPPSHTPFRP
jgi:hypothetical protein